MTRQEELQALKQLRQLHAYKVTGPMIVTVLACAICAFVVGMPILIGVLVAISRLLHWLFY
jgi:Sec-independent protein secretion pathway component TatC